jgi:hypothetical protein
VIDLGHDPGQFGHERARSSTSGALEHGISGSSANSREPELGTKPVPGTVLVPVSLAPKLGPWHDQDMANLTPTEARRIRKAIKSAYAEARDEIEACRAYPLPFAVKCSLERVATLRKLNSARRRALAANARVAA